MSSTTNTDANSDSALLTSLGLDATEAQTLLSNADQLIATYGADMTVERFLELQCEKHVNAIQTYTNQRIQTMQQDADQQISEIRAQYAQ